MLPRALFCICICVCNLLCRCSTPPYPQFSTPKCSKTPKGLFITHSATEPDLRSDQGMATTHLKLLKNCLYLPSVMWLFIHRAAERSVFDHGVLLQSCHVTYNKCILLAPEFWKNSEFQIPLASTGSGKGGGPSGELSVCEALTKCFQQGLTDPPSVRAVEGSSYPLLQTNFGKWNCWA